MDLESVTRLLFDLINVLVWPVLIAILMIKYGKRIDAVLKAKRGKFGAGPGGIFGEWDLTEPTESGVRLQPVDALHKVTSTEPTLLEEFKKQFPINFFIWENLILNR